MVTLTHAAEERVADDELSFLGARTFRAVDTLDIAAEASADARQCLEGLAWEPDTFEVQCERADGLRCDVLVRFASPVRSGDVVNDRVALEWYVARDAHQQPLLAPAVVVVHESGSNMAVGRLFAWGLRQQGVHAFMINLPHYGKRRGEKRPDNAELVTAIRQAVADVRRARDAVAVLPHVDATHIALQGTSLGGFVSATSASLDGKYDSVFLMLAGGDLYNLLQNGEKDTATIRQRLTEAGVTDAALRSMLETIEPTRIAHRLDSQRTWLYSGRYDRVVPLENALALARAAGLDETHHVQLPANHYTGIVYLPLVIEQIAQYLKAQQAAP